MSSVTPTADPSASSTARAFYDHSTMDAFYYQIWGGSDIHIGIYPTPTTAIGTAAQLTVEKMAAQLASTDHPLTSSSRVLDLGAGYGGTARWLAKTYGCKVTCLNLSAVQNERNKASTKEAGLEDLVEVIEGSFEDLPAEVLDKAPYDVVWSLDSFLHAGNLEVLVGEIEKVVARENGRVVFTDLMAAKGAVEKQPELMREMGERLHLRDWRTLELYKGAFEKKGFRDLGYWDGVDHFEMHYRRVGEELEKKRGELGDVDESVIEKQAVGMRNWVKATGEGCVDWGVFCFGR
ncbi:MAG: hypothetical protein LQ344_006574 [Seirophora lacunosa]|nr:MAG: hypothetical protein LQ344_006574 [Seirophora lacunosa]